MSEFKIRAHHGLCTEFFEGKGYDSDFTENMAKIVELLKDDSEITVISGLDDICASCPNNLGEKCSSEEKVKKYDSAVLRLCGIKSGTNMKYKEFKRLVRENIIEKDRLAEVCGDCEWFYICSKTGR